MRRRPTTSPNLYVFFFFFEPFSLTLWISSCSGSDQPTPPRKSCSRSAMLQVSSRGSVLVSRLLPLSSVCWWEPAPSPSPGLRTCRLVAGHRPRPPGSSRRCSARPCPSGSRPCRDGAAHRASTLESHCVGRGGRNCSPSGGPALGPPGPSVGLRAHVSSAGQSWGDVHILRQAARS